MAKNAYLVITDLHWYCKNLRNRFNYEAENKHVYSQILEIASKYKYNGYNVILLFLGDLFHQGYSDTFSAVRVNNVFMKLKEEFGDLYTVVGNHELSYYSNNPFYTLVRDIQSEKLKNVVNKVWTPVGVKNVINVVDRLDDGNVHIYFNHNSVPISKPDTDGVNIGLFHTDMVTEQVKQIAEQRLHTQIWARTCDVEDDPNLFNYKYCFLGHMHQIYGTFLTKGGTYLCYLGSLGRTNVSEVADNFLERDIPAILVEDGYFNKVENNKFNLYSRADSVNEALVELCKDKYENVKEMQAVRSYVPNGDDPVQNVIAALSSSVTATDIFVSLLESNIDNTGINILKRAENYGN